MEKSKNATFCAAAGCYSTEESSSPEICFFPFPFDPDRCAQWLLMCNRKDLASISADVLNKNYKLCSKHFAPSHFVKNHKTLLKISAIPTLNIQIEESHQNERTIMSDCTNNYSILLPQNINYSNSILNESFLSDNHDFYSKKTDTVKPQTDVVLNICRLCSESNSDSHNMLSIFDNESISEHINMCLPIQVMPTDSLPKNICFNCHTRLEKHFKFHQTVIQSDTVLKDMFENICEDSITNENCLNQPISEKLCDENTSNIFHNDHIYAEVLSEGNVALNGRLITLITDSDKGINASNNLIENISIFSDDISENVIVESVEQANDDYLCKDDGKQDIEVVNIINYEENCSDPANIEENCSDSLNVTAVYMCNLCNQFAQTLEQLCTHSVLDHATEKATYPCVLCESLVFTTKDELFIHMNLHKYQLSENLYADRIIIQIENDSNTEMNSFETFQNENSIVEPFEPIEDQTIKRDIASKNNFYCTFCIKRFKSKHRLEFHMKFHVGDEPGFCKICEKHFADENLLYRHVWYLHNGGREKRASSHKTPVKEVQVKNPFDDAGGKCVQCERPFGRLSARLAHEETRHGIKRQCYYCQLCMEAFATTEQISKHLRCDHNYTDPVLEQDMKLATIECLYQCEYCSRLYLTVSALDNHRQLYHSKCQVFTCRHCLEEFSRHEDLLIHVATKSIHDPLPDKELSKRPVARKYFSCQYCAKTFQLLANMMNHKNRHRDSASSLQCEPCSLQFCSLEEADGHKILAHPLMRREKGPACIHKCKYCSKAFPYEASLIKHIRTHTDDRPYRCDFCGKRFRQSSSLTTHTKTHTDERPFSCPHCSQAFKIKGDLTNHMRRHSGVRPFECPTCHKTFMTQHVYSQHCKIHTNHRPYVCKICGSAFRRSHVLKTHILRHSGEKPHSCHLCEKHYRQRGDLLKHFKSQHGIFNRNYQNSTVNSSS